MQKMGMESGGSAPSDMPMFPPPGMDGCGGCGGGGCEPKKDVKSSLPAALANKQMLGALIGLQTIYYIHNSRTDHQDSRRDVC